MPRQSPWLVLRTLALWLLLTVVVTALLSLAPLLDDGFGRGLETDLLNLAALTAAGGLLSIGLVYLIFVLRSLAGLRLARDEVGPAEVVWKEAVANHWQRVWRLPFSVAVGGKLWLTGSRLVFKGHLGQPGVKHVVVPLSEVLAARAELTAGVRHALLIERLDGGSDRFFLPLWESTEEWAAAILVLRNTGSTLAVRHDKVVPPQTRSNDVQREDTDFRGG